MGSVARSNQEELHFMFQLRRHGLTHDTMDEVDKLVAMLKMSEREFLWQLIIISRVEKKIHFSANVPDVHLVRR